MSTWWLCARAIGRASRREWRITVLAVLLIAASVVDLVLAVSWPVPTAGLGAFVLVIAVMAAAVATAGVIRQQLIAAFGVCGSGPGSVALLVGMHAILLGVAGSIVGVGVGLIVRVPLVQLTPDQDVVDRGTVVTSALWCVVVAIVVVAAVATIGAAMATRHQNESRARRARDGSGRFVRLGLSLVAIGAGVSAVAGSANTFGNFEIGLVLFSPLIAVGAVGLASAVLSMLVTLLRARGGASWFVVRSLGTHRLRTLPVLALVTVMVASSATVAIFTSSLHERVEQARTDLILHPDQAWEIDRTAITFSGICDQLPPEQKASAGFCAEPTGQPRRLDPATLADTNVALADPGAEWVLLVVTLLVSLPLILISVWLDRATRVGDDELLEVQGASPSIRRRATLVTAFLITFAGSLTGVLVAVLGTAAGFGIYNNSVRTAQEVVFPPVPFAASVPVLLGFVVLVPLAAAGVSAVLAPRRRLRAGLDLPQRVEQPVMFA